MRTDTLTLAKALDLLARDTICEDGIATAAMQEAAERLREYVADDWQDIGSAPPDESVLIWPMPVHPPVGVAYWVSDDQYWSDDMVRSNGSTPARPTHWKPLPKAPQ